MRVREADEGDMDHLIAMGEAFHAEAALGRIASFDEGSFVESMRAMILSLDALVILAEEEDVMGMAAAVSYKHWFNKDHRGAQELFWYAKVPGCGAPMLKFMEEWAKKLAEHAQEGSFTMVANDLLRPATVGALYKRRGYIPVDRTYTRKF